MLLLLFPLLAELHLSHSCPVCRFAIGVPSCGLATPFYAPAVGLLPAATTAASVSAAWAVLPSTSTGCRVRYSLLLCTCCDMLMLPRLLVFHHSFLWNHPPPLPCSTTFPSFPFRQTPDCSNILTLVCLALLFRQITPSGIGYLV